MKKVGTGLIIGGAVLGTTALVMSTVHAVKAEDYNGVYYAWSQEELDRIIADAKKKQDAELAKSAGWMLGSSFAYSVMFAGIPIRIVGRVKANNLKNALPNSAYVVPNGIKLAWNF
jgi:hypothetical protein